METRERKRKKNLPPESNKVISRLRADHYPLRGVYERKCDRARESEINLSSLGYKNVANYRMLFLFFNSSSSLVHFFFLPSFHPSFPFFLCLSRFHGATRPPLLRIGDRLDANPLVLDSRGCTGCILIRGRRVLRLCPGHEKRSNEISLTCHRNLSIQIFPEVARRNIIIANDPLHTASIGKFD